MALFKSFSSQLFPAAIILLAFAAAASTLVLMMQYTNLGNAVHGHEEECGLSPAEARRLGCVFDVVLMGWVPRRCYDAELSVEFVERCSEWVFYREPGWPNKTSRSVSRVPIEEVLEGEWSVIYAPADVHRLHCTYTWRKTWQTAMRGGFLDGYLGDAHHTNHCEMLLVSGPAQDEAIYMKYVGCPRVRHDIGRFGWYRVVEGRRVYRNP